MPTKITLQHLFPQHILSYLAGKLANCRFAPLKNLFIAIFCKVYKIDLSSAKIENPYAYSTFNAFFTRELKENARPIAQATDAIISPVDGTILQLGKISENQLINAKGFAFTIPELLGNTDAQAFFKNGSFAIIYLAPHNYHRVHAPIDSKLITMTHIPGKLFSVNPKTLQKIPNVFARNERVVNIFDTTIGPAAVILVGAMIVGSIETKWAGTIVGKKVVTRNYKEQNISLNKGEELGKFKLGSTVILLFAEPNIIWNSNLTSDATVKMGEALGSSAQTM